MIRGALTGRELDAAVAERCLGLTLSDDGEFVVKTRNGGITAMMFVPDYSTKMRHAWRVAEWIQERTVVFSLTWADNSRWACGYIEQDGYDMLYEYADTPTEAICRAALALADML